MNSKQQKRYDLELVTMLVTTKTPFNFVKTDGFKLYMNWVVTNLNVEGRHCMSRELTPLLTKNVQSALDDILTKELPHCKKVAFTTDEWQSRVEHPYLSLTLHYFSWIFVLKKYLIACKSIQGLTAPAKLALIKTVISNIKGLKPQTRRSKDRGQTQN